MPSPWKQKLYKSPNMYSPFLWWNAKRQSKSIIKRRWRWGLSKLSQLYTQSTDLIKHVHQNLSMRRLNGQDMIQRMSNVWIIWSSQWRNITISSSSTRHLSHISTCRRGRRGNNTKCVQKHTSLKRDGVEMRNRPQRMTRYPKEKIGSLSKLNRRDLRIKTPFVFFFLKSSSFQKKKKKNWSSQDFPKSCIYLLN